MKMTTWTLTFFVFLLASCQVKEKSASGGLVSGHVGTTNAFTLETPAADTFVTGDTVTLTMSFPFEVIVSGTPQLNLTIGSTSRAASYASGNGTKILTFTYLVVAADNDTNGITVASIGLNGGSLSFNNRGILTACDTTLSAQTFSNLLVDNTAPTITAFSLANAPGFYRVGDTLSFIITYSEPVVVTGTPRIPITMSTGGAIHATYAGGNGTETLSFTYTIENTIADTDGYIITSTIDLNSGTIIDPSANSAVLTFPALVAAVQTYSGTVDVDGRLPYVVSVTPPANGTYAAAQNLDITLTFNRAVNVASTPYIAITIGSTVRQAPYFSGTGTNTFVFRYTLVPGDVDTNGIAIASTITQFGGNITGIAAPLTSYFTNASNNVLSIPTTTSVLCAAIQPQALTVTRNIDSTAPVFGTTPDNVWMIGQQLYLTVGFNTGILVNQTGGTPRIPLTIGATTQYATYLSGGDGQTSLVFTYTIAEGDLDTDASIAIGDIDLNGGTMTDAAATNALLTLPSAAITSTTIDGVKPTISTVTPPADGTYSQVNLASFDFIVTWSEAVDYSSTAAAGAFIPLTIGATTVNAIYASGDQTTTIIHTPASLATFNDSDGIAINSPFGGTGTVRDRAGNTANVFTFVPAATPLINVDSTAPTVLSVTSPAAGRYITGNDLDFVLNFSESVTVTTTGGSPYIRIRIGGNTRNAVVTSAGTGTSHTFRYTVVAADTDPDFVAYFANTITFPGTSSIQDVGLNNLSPVTFSDPLWTGVIVDEVAPTINAASTTASTYVSGADGTNIIVISTTFSEAVTVDTLGGTPSITLAVATGNVNAVYDAGTSTATILKFNYTIDGTTDLDLNGLALGAASIQLNGGTIQDAVTNNATLTIGAVTNLTTSFIVPHATVWMKGSTTNRSGFTTKPTIATTATLSAGYYTFNGSTNTLSFGGVGLGSVFALYMAIRTPAGADTYPQKMLDGGSATFTNNTIDLATSDAPDLKVSSGYTGSGAAHPAAMTVNSTQQIELLFSLGVPLPDAPFITSEFSGDVAEILIFETALSAGQLTEVYSYLNGLYP